MLTQKINGFFNVRVYNAKVEKKDRKFIAEGERITFDVSFEKAPEYLSKYAKPYTTKNGEKRESVTFKIGAKCGWFNAFAEPIDKPTNPELDGKCFETIIDYKQLDGDAASKEASGYWVNSIMISEKKKNPFNGMALAQKTEGDAQGSMNDDSEVF